MPEKEIWKLLEEYLQTKNKDIQDFMNIAALMTQSDNKLYQTYIISKNFWFVERLVEQDKIDKKKLDEAERRPMYVTDDRFSLYKVDECVIMLLSISDTPIDLLCNLLK